VLVGCGLLRVRCSLCCHFSTVVSLTNAFLLCSVSKANYNVNSNKAVTLNVILVYHQSLKNSMKVFNTIKQMTNEFNSTYRLGEKPYQIVKAGDREQHWGAIEKFFGGSKAPDSKYKFTTRLLL
jgi:hypothetical protein